MAVTDAKALMEQLGIAAENQGQIENIQNYFEEHKISELFNEMLTNLLHQKPANAKHFIIQFLKNIQKKDFSKEDPLNKNIYQFPEPFLGPEDFEAIFDSYDVLNI